MNVKEQVRNFLLENPVYSDTVPAELTDDFPLVDAGVLDSIGVYTLVAYLEKAFSIQIQTSDLNEKNFSNLLAIESFIKTRASF